MGGARQGFDAGAFSDYAARLLIAASAGNGPSAGRPAPGGSRENAGETQLAGRAIALLGGGW